MIEEWPKRLSPQVEEPQPEKTPERPKETEGTEERIAEAENHLREQVEELKDHNSELNGLESKGISPERGDLSGNAYEKAAKEGWDTFDKLVVIVDAGLVATGAHYLGEIGRLDPNIAFDVSTIAGAAGIATAALIAIVRVRPCEKIKV